jgi:cell division protein FtsZ
MARILQHKWQKGEKMTHTSLPKNQTPLTSYKPVLKVLGLGGGGCNAVNRMIELGLEGVDYIGANTDYQALQSCLAVTKIQLGPQTTRGLGAGGKPETGEKAAEESARDIAAALQGADMVFIAAGMGGGTGTGSAPIAARIARAMHAVTIAIVTTPFSFEAGQRQRNARSGMEKLRLFSDTLITVPNDRLLYVAPKDLPLELAFRMADDVLRQGIQGIAELITETGLINVDFAHIRRLMQMGGASLMSIGYGEGENKAIKAVKHALNHPLLESASVDTAAGVIANFTGGTDMGFLEVTEALTYLQSETGTSTEIIPGVMSDDRMQGRAQVILIITGLGGTPLESVMPGMQKQTQPEPMIQAAQPLPVTINYQPAPSMRPQAAPSQAPRNQVDSSSSTNLDVPAFLRRRTMTNP